MSSPKDRIHKAGADVQDLTRELADYVNHELTPLERSEAAGILGRLEGIGIGIGWIARYEMSDDEAH